MIAKAAAAARPSQTAAYSATGFSLIFLLPGYPSPISDISIRLNFIPIGIRGRVVMPDPPFVGRGLGIALE